MKSTRFKKLLALVALLPLAAGGCTESPRKTGLPRVAGPQGVTAERPIVPETVNPSTHRELEKLFAAADYDWETLEKGVPPIMLEILPGDMDSIPHVTRKKRIFFLSLLPMVLMANEEISRQREHLIALFERHDRGEKLDANQSALIASLTREYKVKGNPLTDPGARKRLLLRVDIVPPSMALAQAAAESAYGTSRFALKGNNLFGEWTFVPGTGLVPEQRPQGETYEVRRFASLYDSIKSYLKNINTHRAYAALRRHRARARAEGQPIRGMDLAQGLTLYSARKEAYVEEIRAIIRGNGLFHLSTAALRNS